MQSRQTRFAIAFAAAAGLLAPVSAFATNGYFDYGYGTIDKGMAGAGVALPQDSMAAATNPAGMVDVGNRLDVGLALFTPQRQYTTAGGAVPTKDTLDGTFKSGDTLFEIPHFGYNRMLTVDSSVGVDLYGNGGMNTWYNSADYPAGCPSGSPGFTCDGTTGVDLSQLFLSGTYAQKVGNNASLGVSLVGVYQRFKAYGLAGYESYSTAGSEMTDNGYANSHGLGIRIGGLVKVGNGLSLGASYEPKIKMSKFSKYAGLFADQGEFDIPANWTIGAAFQVNPQQALLLDVQKIYYSKVNAVGDTISPLLSGTKFGATSGPGFGWNDMTIYKLGYQIVTGPQWTWRVGYSHASQPIPSSQVFLNALAPGVIEDHYTAGFSYDMGTSGTLDVAAMYAPSHTVSGTNPFDSAQTMSIKMHEYELEANWGIKF